MAPSTIIRMSRVSALCKSSYKKYVMKLTLNGTNTKTLPLNFNEFVKLHKQLQKQLDGNSYLRFTSAHNLNNLRSVPTFKGGGKEDVRKSVRSIGLLNIIFVDFGAYV